MDLFHTTLIIRIRKDVIHCRPKELLLLLGGPKSVDSPSCTTIGAVSITSRKISQTSVSCKNGNRLTMMRVVSSTNGLKTRSLWILILTHFIDFILNLPCAHKLACVIYCNHKIFIQPCPLNFKLSRVKTCITSQVISL